MLTNSLLRIIIILFSTIYFAGNGYTYAQVTIKENPFQSLDIKFQINSEDINLEQVETIHGNFLNLKIKNLHSNNDKIGSPKLPVYQKLIEIPWDADIKVSITRKNEKIIDLKQKGFYEKLLPVQPSLSKNHDTIDLFYLNSETYSKDSFSEAPFITIQKQGYLRGKNMALLSIFPLQYNPVSNQLKVLENIEAKVLFQNADIQKTNYEKARTAYFTNISSDNYKSSFIYSTSPIKYIIVSNPMFRETLKPFVDWKIRQGYKVIEAYTDNPEVGSSPQSIQKYLKDLYNKATPEDPAPLYLLLVGDVEQLPAFEGKANIPNSLGHVTDLYYAEFTDDYLPEMIYGRFPAKNTQQLENMISKTIIYEQYQFSNPSFLDKTMLIAGFESSNNTIYSDGQMNYLESEYFSADKGFTNIKYSTSESFNKTADIKQHLDSGMALVNFSAHCMADGWKNPNISNSSIEQISNDKKYPIIISNCCLSGNFNIDECFGEAFLRSPNGAIGYIGSSDNTFWDEDYYWSVGVGEVSMHPAYESKTQSAFDYWLHQHNEYPENWAITQGQFLQLGNLSVATGSPSKSLYYAEIYNLLGDPSLTPFLKQPTSLFINYQDSLFTNQTELQIETEPYTYVALSSDSTVLAASMSNNEGLVTLNFSPLASKENLYLFANKQFRIPYLDTLHIYKHSQSINSLNTNKISMEISPNPAKNFTNIDLYLPYSMNFSLLIYNMQGVLQEAIFTGIKEKGLSRFLYHKKLNQGTYLCIFLSSSYVFSKKLIISD